MEKLRYVSADLFLQFPVRFYIVDARIVEARSAEQSVWHLLILIDSDKQ